MILERSCEECRNYVFGHELETCLDYSPSDDEFRPCENFGHCRRCSTCASCDECSAESQEGTDYGAGCDYWEDVDWF